MSIVYPVKEVILPSDLKGLENGKLPAGLLKTIKPHGQLHHLTAKCWEAMCINAAEDGVTLTHVGAYRPYKDQEALFLQRYVKGDSGDPRKITRKWNNEVWMLKKGMAPAGSPGTSNHGWGLAIDAALMVAGKLVNITGDPDGKGPLKSGLDWLFENAISHGFSWEIKSGAQAEAWHIRMFTGDKLPERVVATLGEAAAAAPAPAPEVAPKPAKKARPAGAPARKKKQG